jgi:AcrR family transcriptional regulator
MARTERGSVRSQKILEAAVELFYERGFAAVGVDDIGERAGVTGPAIYRHFRGKDEILATLFDDVGDALPGVTSGEISDPFEELRRVVREHVAFILTHRKLGVIRMREERSLAEADARRLQRREGRYLDGWTRLLKQCYPERSDQEIKCSALAAIGAMNSVAHWPPRAIDPNGTAAKVLTATVLRGVGALGEPLSALRASA